jgi:outer membrane immunogenic protein
MRGILIRAGIVVATLLLVVMAARAADWAPRSSFGGRGVADWRGGYIGINGGYGFGQSDWDVPAVTAKPEGFIAGGTLGYNFQAGALLIGLEGDIGVADLKGTIDCPAPAATCESKASWLGTARVRLGFTGLGDWLPYITGGAAFGDITAANSAVSSASDTRLGWTAGAGIEYAMLAHWSLKAEYLYVDLGEFACGAPCGAASDNVGFTASIVRLGLNYRF